MYAVFRSGGKQYRASKGERLRLEKLEADEGASVKFDEVLLVGEGRNIKVGSPLLAGSSVSAKVLRQGKSKKVSVVKFRRRQNYLRQHTHRQFFTEVEITDIKGGGGAKAATPTTHRKKRPLKHRLPRKSRRRNRLPRKLRPKSRRRKRLPRRLPPRRLRRRNLQKRRLQKSPVHRQTGR